MFSIEKRGNPYLRSIGRIDLGYSSNTMNECTQDSPLVIALAVMSAEVESVERTNNAVEAIMTGEEAQFSPINSRMMLMSQEADRACSALTSAVVP